MKLLVLLAAGAGCSLTYAQAKAEQSFDFRARWMAQNYRHAVPPAGGATPVDMGAQFRDVQNTLMAILRKANFAGDFEAALAAAWQAMAGAQMVSAAAARETASSEPATASPVYLIAFKDQSIRAALAWWVEAGWLHYITRQGAHEQVALDRVDRDFTRELNRQRRVRLELPEAPGS